MFNKALFVLLFLLLTYHTVHTEDKPVGEEAPYAYDHRGRRDPFVSLVGSTTRRVESLEDIMSIEDVSFQGIAFDSTGKKVVIINSEMVKEGGGGGRLTVKKILRDEVILAIDDEEYRLSIYESNNE